MPRLAPIEPEAVTRIEIQLAGEESAALAKRKGRWHLTRPMEIVADGSVANAIAAVVQSQSHTQLPVVSQRLGDFGLAPPRARLRINDLELAFGDAEPLHGRRYVLVEDAVHLIADQFFHYLTQPAEHFVHPAPLGPQAEIVALVLPGLHVELIDEKWQVQGPEEIPPAHRVDALVDAWRHARAVAVQKRDETLTAQHRVRVGVRGVSAPLDFELARRGQHVFIVRPDLGIQYLLAAHTGKQLFGAMAINAPR